MTSPVLSTPGHLISLAARLFARLSEARLLPLGFGVGHLPVLVALGEGRMQTQRELARFARIEQPSMAQMLARMERDGLIRRTTSITDRRASLVALTVEAEAALPRACEALLKGNREALDGFTDEEAATFVAMLQRVITNLDAMVNPGSPAREPDVRRAP